MPWPSGMFYAYLECEESQYLVAFPSRSYANRFWRIVQSVCSGSPDECRRFSAQFMSVPVLPNRVQSDGWDRRSCLVRYIGEDQAIPVVPVDHRPDILNCGMFYIRSTIRPEFYWYFEETNGQVGVSKIRHSRFMLQRASALPYQVRQEEDILVEEDDIILSVVLSENQQRGRMVNIVGNQRGRLVQANGHHGSFKIWFFENGFRATYAGEEGSVLIAEPRNGERWELVA